MPFGGKHLLTSLDQCWPRKRSRPEEKGIPDSVRSPVPVDSVVLLSDIPIGFQSSKIQSPLPILPNNPRTSYRIRISAATASWVTALVVYDDDDDAMMK